jgi:hypothetical protein
MRAPAGTAQEQTMSRSGYYDLRAGPIAGLNLPFATWAVLRREHITTLDQLKAAAGWLERFDGIGPKTARMIREELARVAPPDQDQ